VGDARGGFLESVRGYSDAMARLEEELADYRAWTADGLRAFESGATLTEVFTERESAARSLRMTALLEQLEHQRRRTREAGAVVLLEEGRTVTEVGNSFGTTHQWASRLLKGAQADTGSGAPPAGGPDATGAGDRPAGD
jgi:hypothetical protein